MKTVKKILLLGVALLSGLLLMGQAPKITNFSPKLGKTSDIIDILGSNLCVLPADNAVYFGPTRAEVLAVSATSMTVRIPSGATYAPIAVTNTMDSLTGYSRLPFLATFPGGGNINASAFSRAQKEPGGMSPFDVILADITGDGKADLLVSEATGNHVYLRENTSMAGSITFANPITFTAGSFPGGLAAGDLNGDGLLDVVVTNANTPGVSVFINTGNAAAWLAAKQDFATAASPQRVAITDLNGDGLPDIVTGNKNLNAPVSILLNTRTAGVLSFGTHVDLPGNTDAYGVACGDLDIDGKPDIVVSSFNDSSVSVYLNQSSGTSLQFAAAAKFKARDRTWEVKLGDFDGDSRLDMVVADYGSPAMPGETVSVFHNTTVTAGSLSFDPSQAFYADLNPRGVAMGDLNGDGKPDLVCSNMNSLSSNLSVLQNNSTLGTISFGNGVNFVADWGPNSVSVGDLDGDNKPDLVTAVFNANMVAFFRNTFTPSVSVEDTWPEAGLILYPQPVTDAINLLLTLPEPAQLSIQLWSIEGRVLRDLFDGIAPGGVTEWEWAVQNFPPGVYLLVVQNRERRLVKKFQLLR